MQTAQPLTTALREFGARMPRLSESELMKSLTEMLASFGYGEKQMTALPSGDTLKASLVQVGGNHYKHFAIQPSEFCQKNKLDHCESAAIKYLCRHKLEGGKGLQDLLKARHFIDLIIEWEYDERRKETDPSGTV